MINKNELLKIGKLLKPHGLQGELSFCFDVDVFDDDNEIPYFVCEIDGIFVPFFTEEYRFKTDETGLIKFEGIDSEDEAKELTNCELYISKKILNQDEDNNSEYFDDDFYIGYKIISNNEEIGEIIDIDNSTENVLFIINSKDNEEILIPAQDDFIIEIDDNNKIISMNLPDGLLDLDSVESDEE